MNESHAIKSIGDYAFSHCSGLTIYCVENSFAHTYAVEHDIPFSFGQPPAKLLTYTITFDANGGSDLSQSSRTVESGTAIGELPAAMRTDYTLKGWYTAKKGGNLVTKDMTVTEDLVLYAQWDKVVPDKGDGQDEVVPDKDDKQDEVVPDKDDEPDEEEMETLSIDDAVVTLSKTTYSYDGKAKKPAIKSVRLGNAVLKSGTDYSAVISYKNNKNIGKAAAIVELAGKGNYTGKASISVTFTISAKKRFFIYCRILQI